MKTSKTFMRNKTLKRIQGKIKVYMTNFRRFFIFGLTIEIK